MDSIEGRSCVVGDGGSGCRGVAGAGGGWGTGCIARGTGDFGAGVVRIIRGLIALQPALGRRGGRGRVTVSREVGAGPRSTCGGDRSGSFTLLRVHHGVRGGGGDKRPDPARRWVYALEGRRAGELGP